MCVGLAGSKFGPQSSLVFHFSESQYKKKLKKHQRHEHWGGYQWHVVQKRSKRYKRSRLKSDWEERRSCRGDTKEEEEKEEGYREITTVCEITNAGINSTINLLSISVCFPSSSASDFTAVSNYSALNISTQRHCSTLPSFTPNTPHSLLLLPFFSPSSRPPLFLSHLLFAIADSSQLSEGHQLTV